MSSPSSIVYKHVLAYQCPTPAPLVTWSGPTDNAPNQGLFCPLTIHVMNPSGFEEFAQYSKPTDIGRNRSRAMPNVTVSLPPAHLPEPSPPHKRFLPVLTDVPLYLPTHELTFILDSLDSGKSTISQLLLSCSAELYHQATLNCSTLTLYGTRLRECDVMPRTR